MTQIDYKKVFSKLSHIKALSHDQKFDQIVQNIITYSLFQNNKAIVKTEKEVADNVYEIYGIAIRENIIQSNLDKLLSIGEVIKDQSTKQYILNSTIVAKIKQRLEDSNALEVQVKFEWQGELKSVMKNYDDSKFELLWKSLKSYLCIVFEQHGIQTLNLLNPNAKINEEDQRNLTLILEQIANENDNICSKGDLSVAINQFITNANELRTNYISQLADATFTSFALTSDAETVNFLNSRYNNLFLFLDTNFIFGVLDLHKNTEDASAREILEEAKKNSLPFKLTYHPETLLEFKRAFDARALRVRATKWTRESSRVALKIDGLSPLEILFHQQNLESEIDPSVFLDKYEHVDLILKDLGLIEYTPKQVTDLEQGEIESDVEDYRKFYDSTPNRKSKSYLNFKHDVLVLREVRSLNPKKTKFLESKSFFISSDFILHKFEKTHYKKNWEINYVVSPSVFLQLIRPFIQNDYFSNKRFIDTFSIPELRTFEIDYSTTRSKALQILNDNYHDTSFETKVKILRDQVLLEKLDKLNEDYEKQVMLIESQIAIENRILAEEKRQVEEEIKKEKADKETAIEEKRRADEIIELEKAEKERAQNEVISKVTEIDSLKQDYAQKSIQDVINHKKEMFDVLNESFIKSENSQIPLLKIITKRTNQHKLKLISIPVIFYTIMFFLIYKFSWNVMEPFTWTLTAFTIVGGYIYLAVLGENFDPQKYFIKKKDEIAVAVYKEFSFDLKELEHLQVKKSVLEQELEELTPI